MSDPEIQGPNFGTGDRPETKVRPRLERGLWNPDPGSRWVLLALAGLILAYAVLAGCYTLRNFDLGWQLAAGRFIAQTGHIPRQDVFSFTAQGREFVYPAGAELLLYRVFELGGYPWLVLLGMVTCASVVLLVLLANREALARPALGLFTLALAVLAVPAIASRSSPRADIFTLVLFAAGLLVLLRFHRGFLRGLYLLPLLFAVWANLHQGFVFGLLLFVPFGLALLLAMRDPNPAVRALAGRRLRRLSISAAASCAAVLLNPWGWRIYSSLLAVGRDMAFQYGLIGEASPMPVGLWRLRDAFRFGDADAGIWLLALLALAGLMVAACRGQVAPALLLAGALLLGVRYARAQALFAIVACAVLPGVFVSIGAWTRSTLTGTPQGTVPPSIHKAAFRVVSILLLLAVWVRAAELSTGRYYAWRADTASFGLGVSWWFPERAIDFILREHLPGRIYSDYNLGGWLMWRLYPSQKVYIDGRAQPFTPDVFLEEQDLLAASPDSPTWQETFDRRDISTVVLSLARYGGYRVSPAALCGSARYRLVYLDEVSGVWLRVKPENQWWLDRLGYSCDASGLNPDSESYDSLANAAQLYYVLGRDAEAAEAWRKAEAIYPGEPNLRLAVAHYFQTTGRTAEARREYRQSLAERDSAQAWHSLGLLEVSEQRFAEAAADFRRAAERSVLPHESYRMLGESLLALGQPRQALAVFSKARGSSHYRDTSREPARSFTLAVEEGERRAREMMGNK